MPPSPLPRLRPLGRAVLQRLRLLGWSYVVAGLSAAGVVVALVLGALALPLLLPVGSTVRPAIFITDKAVDKHLLDRLFPPIKGLWPRLDLQTATIGP